MGEEGVDAGALQNDFFESVLKHLNDKLFEGTEFRRVPKKDWALEHWFEMAGMIISHSLIQRGPGFPCMCPAVYNYMVYRSKDRAMQELPLKEDITLSMATAGLFTLIEQVSTYCVQKAFLFKSILVYT